jgi:hypothetical protein
LGIFPDGKKLYRFNIVLCVDVSAFPKSLNVAILSVIGYAGVFLPLSLDPCVGVYLVHLPEEGILRNFLFLCVVDPTLQNYRFSANVFKKKNTIHDP